MGRIKKTFDRVLSGNCDQNLSFAEIRALMHALGFRERIRGSHHIFVRDGIEEIINLQALGSHAKGYQVRQIRRLIESYALGV